MISDFDNTFRYHYRTEGFNDESKRSKLQKHLKLDNDGILALIPFTIHTSTAIVSVQKKTGSRLSKFVCLRKKNCFMASSLMFNNVEDLASMLKMSNRVYGRVNRRRVWWATRSTSGRTVKGSEEETWVRADEPPEDRTSNRIYGRENRRRVGGATGFTSGWTVGGSDESPIVEAGEQSEGRMSNRVNERVYRRGSDEQPGVQAGELSDGRMSVVMDEVGFFKPK
jgi:hypothetical protein